MLAGACGGVEGRAGADRGIGKGGGRVQGAFGCPRGGAGLAEGCAQRSASTGQPVCTGCSGAQALSHAIQNSGAATGAACRWHAATMKRTLCASMTPCVGAWQAYYCTMYSQFSGSPAKPEHHEGLRVPQEGVLSRPGCRLGAFAQGGNWVPLSRHGSARWTT